jgi:hypothetical protein
MKSISTRQRKSVITSAQKKLNEKKSKKKKEEQPAQKEEQPVRKGTIKKGEIRNPTGKGLKPKQAGVPNRITRDIKEAFTYLLEKNIDNMDKWLTDVAEEDPVKALRIMIDLAPYVVPRLVNQQVKVEQTQSPKYDLTKLNVNELETLIKLSDKASINIINEANIDVDNQNIIDVDIQEVKKDE